MRKKHLLSLFMLSMGVALLVTAFAVSGASAARQTDVLTIGTIGKVFSPDPATGYDTRSWTLQSATNLTLVGYADSNAANAPLQYQGATGIPVISNKGKVYTWTIRSGYHFSDNTLVTAASYARSFERILSPCSYAGGWGSADAFDVDIVGGAAFHHGTCSGGGLVSTPAHITGISATSPPGGGGTLTIHLTKAVPALLPAMAMQWFGAVPVGTPYNGANADPSTGPPLIPSPGPYYVTSWNKSATAGQFNVILQKNPHYDGPRTQGTDTIRWLKYNSGANESCYSDVTANNIDLDMCGLTATEVTSAHSAYGAVTSTGVPAASPGTVGQFHVEATGCSGWIALNTQVAPTKGNTTGLKVRMALGYIVDKDHYLSVLGSYAGQYGSSIMTPAIPGYKADNVFGHHPNWQKAAVLSKKGSVLGGLLKNKTIHVWYVGDTDPGVQQWNSLQSDLQGFSDHYHLNMTIIGDAHQNTNYYDDLGTYQWALHGGNTASGPSGPYNMAAGGWCADYLDAFDYINVMFSGSFIDKTDEGANVNWSYANIGALNKQMAAAAKLSGHARNAAYAKADKAIVGKYALAIPYEIIGARILTSNRVGNYHYNEYATTPSLNTLTVS